MNTCNICFKEELKNKFVTMLCGYNCHIDCLRLHNTCPECDECFIIETSMYLFDN